MIETVLATASSHILGMFLLSAGLVRWAPHAYSSRQIRRQFWLFPVLPILLVFDLVQLVDRTGRLSSRLLRRTFELLSGRKLLDESGKPYVYFGQYAPRRKHHRRSELRHGTAAAQHRLSAEGRAPVLP